MVLVSAFQVKKIYNKNNNINVNIRIFKICTINIILIITN